MIFLNSCLLKRATVISDLRWRKYYNPKGVTKNEKESGFGIAGIGTVSVHDTGNAEGREGRAV